MLLLSNVCDAICWGEVASHGWMYHCLPFLMSMHCRVCDGLKCQNILKSGPILIPAAPLCLAKVSVCPRLLTPTIHCTLYTWPRYIMSHTVLMLGHRFAGYLFKTLHYASRSQYDVYHSPKTVCLTKVSVCEWPAINTNCKIHHSRRGEHLLTLCPAIEPIYYLTLLLHTLLGALLSHNHIVHYKTPYYTV